MKKDTRPLSPPGDVPEWAEATWVLALTDLTQALVSLVKRVAWLPHDHMPEPLCPWCGVYKSGGHSETCERQAALKLAETLMPFDWDKEYKRYLKKSQEEDEASR